MNKQTNSNTSYEIIVVGAGHAGLEAAFASANKNHKTAIFALDEACIGEAPCNPSIGGPAKGIVTREIDALGGMQGIVTDECALQIKLLNSSKGPGVWALRAQIDKEKYHETFLKLIKKHKNLDLILEEVVEILTENNKVIGVRTPSNIYLCKKVVITTGTYMKATIHVGHNTKDEGPNKHPRSNNLSTNLKQLGFTIKRLKTGTPPRILEESLDKSKVEVQPGTDAKLAFHLYQTKFTPINKQAICYLTHTCEKTHEIIRSNLKKSAMYSGNIHGVGPRYCPSIEDKVVRFSDKPRHQIFIEPISKNSNWLYLQGLSTSFPIDVQEQIVHSINGLENAKIVQYAYAIEYDAIDAQQLWLSLESKVVEGLYCAGQINGTSGYEEAAGQGLIAGLNAALSIENKDPVILNRNNSYIGVMIDDIVTKGVNDPYRLLTSRAEHRLLLRNDNVDDRLIKIGYEAGLVPPERFNQYLIISASIDKIINYLKTTTLKTIPELSKKYHNHNLYDLLKQPQVHLIDVLPKEEYLKLSDEVKSKIEILVKFDGYIKHETKNLNKFEKYLDFKIEGIDDYHELKNLALDAREKLNKVKPINLLQASKIPGISINDLMIIKYYIETKDNK